jgi:hypothetical protein
MLPMNNLPGAPDLLAVARRVVWFKEPQETLKDPRLLPLSPDDLHAARGCRDGHEVRES